jgi:hypothetical protein
LGADNDLLAHNLEKSIASLRLWNAKRKFKGAVKVRARGNSDKDTLHSKRIAFVNRMRRRGRSARARVKACWFHLFSTGYVVLRKRVLYYKAQEILAQRELGLMRPAVQLALQTFA